MARLIDADMLKEAVCPGCDSCEEMQCDDCALIHTPTVDAIPVEWLDFQIEYAKQNGFFKVVKAFNLVKDSWVKTKFAWEREQEFAKIKEAHHD